MTQEDYVSFETAKFLKEKGFNWSTDKQYYLDKIVGDYNITDRSRNPERYIDAPTLQMAMKWLREVHKIHVSVEMGFDVDNHQYFFFVPSICKFSNKTGEYQTPFGEKEFDTYEEACEAGIRYCLEKLI